MQFNQTLEDALHTWASNERQTLHLGYPAVAAGFSQYRAGYRTSPRIPSQFDIDTLSLVERGIGHMRKWPDTRPVMVLTEYYGAYPDAPPKEKRMEAVYSRVAKRRAYEALEKAKTYLQGIIDVYAQDIA